MSDLPSIRLKFCRIEWTGYGCRTWFDDGTHVDAAPHPEMPHYIRVAADCGYDDDTLAYAREHEFAHSLVSEWVSDEPSAVLWALAHGEVAPTRIVVYEEIAAQAVQRWIRKNERPIISGFRADALKERALELLGDRKDIR